MGIPARGGEKMIEDKPFVPKEVETYAWYWNNSKAKTHKVGLKLANVRGFMIQ